MGPGSGSAVGTEGRGTSLNPPFEDNNPANEDPRPQKKGKGAQFHQEFPRAQGYGFGQVKFLFPDSEIR